MELFRGNAFEINVTIKAEGENVNINDIDLVEFSLGENIKKMYPGPSVTYNNNKFVIKIYQEDTFGLDYTFSLQGRVKFTNGSIFASPIIEYNLNNSLSREIL